MIALAVSLYLVTLVACVAQTTLQRALPVVPVLGGAWRFNVTMVTFIFVLPVLGSFVSPSFTWTGWFTTSWLMPVAFAGASLARVRLLVKMRRLATRAS